MDDFLLRVGIDSTNIKNPLSETIEILHKVESTAKETGKGVTDAFTQSGSSIDKVEQKLKPLTKDLEALKILGKQAGKELADAFKSGNVELLEKKVVEFQKKLSGMSAKLDIEIDATALGIFEKQLENTDNAVQQLAAGVDFAKSILNSLDPNSEEFAALSQNINIAEAAITEFGEQTQNTVNKNKSLKAELRELKQELAAMELRGEAGSKKFKEMSQRAGELTDQIGDTNAQIKALASDTKMFDALISGAQGLTGGFVAAQGAVAMFAGENEDLEKILIKVNGAMAILQGLQAVAETLNKDSALSVILLSRARQADTVATEAQTGATILQTVAMNGASVAAKLLRFSLSAIGLGLIISLIAYLVANWDKLKASMEKILPAGTSVAGTFDKLKSVFVGVGTALVEYIIAPFKIAISLITEGLDGAVEQAKKSYNVVDNYNKGFREQEKRNLQNHLMEQKKQRLEDWDNQIKIAEAEGKDTYATRSKWYKNKIAVAKKEGEDTKALLQEQAEFEARRRGEMAKKAADDAKKASDEAKKRAEDAQKKAEEAERKRQEFKKQQDALLFKYTDEIQKLTVEKMEDGFEKEKKAIEADAKSKIEQLKQDGAKRGDVLAKQKELEQAITDAANAKITALEKKHNEELESIKMEGAKMLLDLTKDSTQKELDLADLEHKERVKEIETKFKDETDLKVRLLKQEDEYYQKTRADITREGNQKQLSEQEQLEISSLEIISFYGAKTEEAEEQKQLAILEIQRKYAVQRLNDLIANGGSELEVNNAILAVQKIEKSLEDYSKKGKKFDLFKLMGIDGNLTKEQKENISNAAKQIADDIGQMADFVVEQYQRQIDKKQEVIDQYTNEIEDLESRIETEKELRSEGLANNVDTLEKELEAKKAQREEEIKQQKEIAEKQAQIRKAQMLAETAFQLVGMITSSVNIFEHATEMFGPFGVPIAIASIAAMFGAFAVAKTKAFQAINSGQKYREGGEIGFGGSHEAGGSKFYAEDGSGFEAERGEYITKKSSYRKYRKFVEAFNKDDFSGLSFNDFEAVGLFEKIGVSLQNENIYDAVNEVNANRTILHEFAFAGNDTHFSKMSDNLEYLAKSERGKSETWEDANYYYVKKGTRIIKTPKK